MPLRFSIDEVDLLSSALGFKGSSCLCTEPSKCAPDSIAIVLCMISPSTLAEAVNLTFKPLIRPTILPFTTMSSAITSPFIRAVLVAGSLTPEAAHETRSANETLKNGVHVAKIEFCIG